MKLTNVYKIQEGKDSKRARDIVIRVLDRALAEADKHLAAGQKDRATSVIRQAATEVDTILLSLANDVAKGTKS